MSLEPNLIDIRIADVQTAAEDIKIYTLQTIDGSPLPAAAPGAHIDLHLRPDVIRPYSLIAAGVALAYYSVGVKREAPGRGGSRLLHDEFHGGDTLKISAPRNNFPLNPQAEHSILIAGGIGITPIYSMATYLASAGASFEVHYGSRSRAFCAFYDELKALGPNVHVYFDDEVGPGAIDFAALARKTGSDLYCCGPGGMLNAFEKNCAALPPARVHLERFNADVDAITGRGFVLELAASGKSITVPEGKSILQCLNEIGVEVPYSCEQGVCGTCETRVLEGIPDHRDLILSEKERASGKTIMICCSRSLTPLLKLDL